jgi:hypothetical protein
VRVGDRNPELGRWWSPAWRGRAAAQQGKRGFSVGKWAGDDGGR